MLIPSGKLAFWELPEMEFCLHMGCIYLGFRVNTQWNSSECYLLSRQVSENII
jgi:hypothetical protein